MLTSQILVAAALVSGWWPAAPADGSGPGDVRPPGASYVRVSETTVHGDMDCFEIETPAATYLYGKRGAGFASILDKDGRDWISYRPGGKARGEYRGLPKCGQPTKFFHCGYGYGQYRTDNPFTSRVTARAADHARIESETRDGRSACAWDFYADRATLTLLRIGQPTFWFLYEGTPGGRLDAAEDFVIRPDGRRTTLDQPWSQAVRWTCFGASETKVGLVLVNHQDPEPGEVDSFVAWPFRREGDGSYQDMTVFGFGRKGYKELIEHVPDLKRLPARFSVGFIDRADFDTARAACERLLADGEARPVSIFNGKDLGGWSGDLDRWTDADGAITGSSTAEQPLKTWTSGGRPHTMNSMRKGDDARRRGAATGRYRILALDVDGTLLDPEGRLRPRTAEAVARAARAGIRPVLCTGRRYRRARPITELLGLNAPIVCNSGAIVKDPSDHRTLWRADFDPALAADVRSLFHDHDLPAVVFTDRDPAAADFRVPAFPTGRVMFDDYVHQNRPHAEVDPAWAVAGEAIPGAEPWFHVCAIGAYDEMSAFARSAHARIDGRIQTFVLRTSRYLGTMCEILRVDASKWTALLHLAELWGIGPEEICAVGDDANDIPMIRHAGLGVAMGHAHAEVQTAADIVTGRHDEDGVAMLVDEVLLAS